jgi:hypothetical protein
MHTLKWIVVRYVTFWIILTSDMWGFRCRLYFFWGIARRKLVVAYRRLGTTVWSHTERSSSPSRLGLLSRNFGNKLPTYIALHSKRTKASKLTCCGWDLVADFGATGNELRRLWEVRKLLSSRASINFSKTSLLRIRLETRLDMQSGCMFCVTVKCNNRSDMKKGIWRESSIKKEKWRGKEIPKDILVEYPTLRCFFELTQGLKISAKRGWHNA